MSHNVYLSTSQEAHHLAVATKKDRTIFVGDLSFFCQDSDLYELFSPFGIIQSVRIKRSPKGDSLLFGFVVMNSHESAARAVYLLLGKEFMGRNLRLQLESAPPNDTYDRERSKLIQVHVSFVTNQVSSFLLLHFFVCLSGFS
jgi:RNA recognition motif-containing protein